MEVPPVKDQFLVWKGFLCTVLHHRRFEGLANKLQFQGAVHIVKRILSSGCEQFNEQAPLAMLKPMLFKDLQMAIDSSVTRPVSFLLCTRTCQCRSFNNPKQALDPKVKQQNGYLLVQIGGIADPI